LPDRRKGLIAKHKDRAAARTERKRNRLVQLRKGKGKSCPPPGRRDGSRGAARSSRRCSEEKGGNHAKSTLKGFSAHPWG